MADETDAPKNKVVVITGASSGIGHATALEFAKQGYDLMLVARRKSVLSSVAKECREHGVRAEIATADTAIDADMKKVVDTVQLTYGHFDVWVNNAAVSLFGKFDETPVEDFRRVIETNFFGYVNGARLAITQFKKQGHGILINVTSVNGAVPQPYTSAYVASKYALKGLSDSIRMELKLDGLEKNIKVCNAMPASVDTNLFQNAANYTNREVQALEPVYSATYVAKQIAKLAKHPRREFIIGSAGKMMALEHATSPSLYEKLTSKFIDRNHLSKTITEDTTGNLYEPIQENTGISGGWRETRVRADKMNMAIGASAAVAVAVVGVGYAMTRKKH